eukprot:Platyproteum_vivax@DN7641_c0_g1_i3.p1
MREQSYSYTGFLKAIGKFSGFCKTYNDGRDSDAICKKSLAVMIAHFSQETGAHDKLSDTPEWRQGLKHVREMNMHEGMKDKYAGECNPKTWQGEKWPCGTFPDGAFKSYFGRGAKQLSYNYNYGPFSEFIYGEVGPLLQEPTLVADTWLNFASAVFFYLFPQPPKPSMLFVMDGTWQPNARDQSNGLVHGFGVTIQIINGGVECGGGNELQQSKNRISYYRSSAEYFGVPIPADEVLGCSGMKQFDEYGAGALNIYYEEDYTWTKNNPSGKSYACKLVNYQTAYSTFSKGAYAECVKKHFPETNFVDDGPYVPPPATPAPTGKAATPTPPPARAEWAPYRAGASYKGGDTVTNKGDFYQCINGRDSWCSGAGWAYAPGAGNAWSMAWNHCPEKVC